MNNYTIAKFSRLLASLHAAILDGSKIDSYSPVIPALNDLQDALQQEADANLAREEASKRRLWRQFTPQTRPVVIDVPATVTPAAPPINPTIRCEAPRAPSTDGYGGFGV